jgi:hypothetical protein
MMDKKWFPHPDWVNKGHKEGEIVPGKSAPNFDFALKYDFSDLQAVVNDMMLKARQRNQILKALRQQKLIFKGHIEILTGKIANCSDSFANNAYESERVAYKVALKQIENILEEYDDDRPL